MDIVSIPMDIVSISMDIIIPEWDVIIPKENERDLKEIPENLTEDLEIIAVKWIEEVLSVALEKEPKPLSDEEYTEEKKTPIGKDIQFESTYETP